MGLVMTILEETARELGFKISKLPKRGSGYVLKNTCHDDIDEFPLGDDFSASLSDVEDYLERRAADIAAGRVKPSNDADAEPEVETSIDLAKLKPASPAAMHKSLGGHENASEIKPLVGNAKAATPKPTVTLHDLNLQVRALKAETSTNRTGLIRTGCTTGTSTTKRTIGSCGNTC
jgi:hypothetical protein